MKLNAERIDGALTQFNAEALPQNHPVLPQFNELFGDHTFFINSYGLSIIEPIATRDDGVEIGRVVRLANWLDESRSKLSPHERETTDMTVLLSDAA